MFYAAINEKNLQSPKIGANMCQEKLGPSEVPSGGLRSSQLDAAEFELVVDHLLRRVGRQRVHQTPVNVIG